MSKELGFDVSDNDALVLAYAQSMIDVIKERTDKYKDVNGDRLKKYSESYTQSDIFKAASKGRSEVNMRLTSEMMDTIDVIEQNGSVVKIGWDDGFNSKKAYAHMTAFKGHPTIKSAPVREFFGITKKEIKEINKSYRTPQESIQNKNDNKILEKLQKLFGF